MDEGFLDTLRNSRDRLGEYEGMLVSRLKIGHKFEGQVLLTGASGQGPQVEQLHSQYGLPGP